MVPMPMNPLVETGAPTPKSRRPDGGHSRRAATLSMELPTFVIEARQSLFHLDLAAIWQQKHFFLDRGLAFNVEQTGGVGGHIPDGRQGLLRLALLWPTQRLG